MLTVFTPSSGIVPKREAIELIPVGTDGHGTPILIWDIPMAARATVAQTYREQAVLQRLGDRKAGFQADSRPELCPQPKGDLYQRDQNRNLHQWADNRGKGHR